MTLQAIQAVYGTLPNPPSGLSVTFLASTGRLLHICPRMSQRSPPYLKPFSSPCIAHCLL